MTKETIKELGKLAFDASKITFAVAIVTPLVKGGDIEIFPMLVVFEMIIIGIYLINKGTQDERFIGCIWNNGFYDDSFCSICSL